MPPSRRTILALCATLACLAPALARADADPCRGRTNFTRRTCIDAPSVSMWACADSTDADGVTFWNFAFRNDSSQKVTIDYALGSTQARAAFGSAEDDGEVDLDPGQTSSAGWSFHSRGNIFGNCRLHQKGASSQGGAAPPTAPPSKGSFTDEQRSGTLTEDPDWQLAASNHGIEFYWKRYLAREKVPARPDDYRIAVDLRMVNRGSTPESYTLTRVTLTCADGTDHVFAEPTPTRLLPGAEQQIFGGPSPPCKNYTDVVSIGIQSYVTVEPDAAELERQRQEQQRREQEEQAAKQRAQQEQAAARQRQLDKLHADQQAARDRAAAEQRQRETAQRERLQRIQEEQEREAEEQRRAQEKLAEAERETQQADASMAGALGNAASFRLPGVRTWDFTLEPVFTLAGVGLGFADWRDGSGYEFSSFSTVGAHVEGHALHWLVGPDHPRADRAIELGTTATFYFAAFDATATRPGTSLQFQGTSSTLAISPEARYWMGGFAVGLAGDYRRMWFSGKGQIHYNDVNQSHAVDEATLNAGPDLAIGWGVSKQQQTFVLDLRWLPIGDGGTGRLGAGLYLGMGGMHIGLEGLYDAALSPTAAGAPWAFVFTIGFRAVGGPDHLTVYLPPRPRPRPHPRPPPARPPPDADGDGVPDASDACPTRPGPAANDGCPPDSDGDGIADDIDKCPHEPGPLANGGCPVPPAPPPTATPPPAPPAPPAAAVPPPAPPAATPATR